jgi:hypothetical protein
MQGYYTAPETDYVKAMNVYFKKFMADPTFENVIAGYQTAPIPAPVVVSPPVVAPPPPAPVPAPTPPPVPVKPPSTGIGDLVSKVFSFFGKK